MTTDQSGTQNIRFCVNCAEKHGRKNFAFPQPNRQGGKNMGGLVQVDNPK